MQNTLIDQGLSLMVYGMGTVFVFLAVLILATTLMSKLVTRFSNNEILDKDVEGSDEPSPQILSAIKAAIALHRQA